MPSKIKHILQRLGLLDIVKKSIKYPDRIPKGVARIMMRAVMRVVTPVYSRMLNLQDKKDIFIICERWGEAEARDNGYALFKYLRETYPEKPVYYIFNTSKKNIDYYKLLPLGNILPYGSLETFAYVSRAKYFATTHTLLYQFERKGADIDNITTCFLQHGVIINDLGDYFKNDIAVFDMICCGSVQEFEYLNKMSEGLHIKPIYTGLARWDRLHHIPAPKRQILIMPTWRKQMSMDTKKFTTSKKEFYDDSSRSAGRDSANPKREQHQ